jgi:hypothetical protein
MAVVQCSVYERKDKYYGHGWCNYILTPTAAQDVSWHRLPAHRHTEPGQFHRRMATHLVLPACRWATSQTQGAHDLSIPHVLGKPLPTLEHHWLGSWVTLVVNNDLNTRAGVRGHSYIFWGLSVL